MTSCSYGGCIDRPDLHKPWLSHRRELPLTEADTEGDVTPVEKRRLLDETGKCISTKGAQFPGGTQNSP